MRKTPKEILQSYLDVDNTPMKGNEWIIDAMEDYAKQEATNFADYLLNDFEMDDIEGELAWRLGGTTQKHTTQELYANYYIWHNN